ncbi:sodium:calcium antiporter, partial [Candidatus Woesearchaeota archaeon]|nr:sodium:calcium antiporter [Candidatus Woesearchaeota archaeon]
MIYIDVLIGLGALILLLFSSSVVVKAAENTAKALRVTPFVIGVTVTSIGTSLPEIFTSVAAGFNNLNGIESSGIAVGNIIGSGMANITIVLGLVGLFVMFRATKRSLRRDGTMLIVGVVAFLLTSIDGFISRKEGIILIAIYLAYLVYVLYQEKIIQEEDHVRTKASFWKILIDFVFIFAGIALIIYSSDMMVDKFIHVAETLQIRPSLIGIFVGLGTSLPELSVSLVAVAKRAKALSLGNLIGSNICDPLLALGSGAVISGFTVARSVLFFDFAFWILATLIVLFLLWNNL